MATVPKLAFGTSVVMLDPKTVRPHPQNPRRDIESDPKTVELVGLIKLHGQTTPALVRPKDGAHEVILGHRRRVACELLGEQLKSIVEQLSDEKALAIMLADNAAHLEVDPFMEADAVKAFLDLPGWKVSDVAAQLGKSVHWVASRANLGTLSAKWRRAIKSEGAATKWPVDWLAEIAKCDPETQDAFLAKVQPDWIREEKDLKRELANYLHVLKGAPWKLDDNELLPKAGPCSSCPKTSLSTPGLFDDEEVSDPKKATCRDALCWGAKTQAHVMRQVAKAREENPETVLLDGRGGHASHRPKELRDAKVLPEWNVQPCKKSDKGAVPALVVSGAGAGSKTWVKTTASYGPRKKKAKGKAKKGEAPADERLEESRAKIEARRKAFFVDRVNGRLRAVDDEADLDDAEAEGEPRPEKLATEKLATPDFSVVAGLVAAFEASPARVPSSLNETEPGGEEDELDDDYILVGARPRSRIAIFDACVPDADIINEAAWVEKVWPRVTGSMRQALQRHNPRNLDEQHELAKWIARILEIDAAAIEAEAVVQIPDPKWWGADAKAKLKASARASATAAKSLRDTADWAASEGLIGSKGKKAKAPKANKGKGPPIPAAAAEAIHKLHTGELDVAEVVAALEGKSIVHAPLGSGVACVPFGGQPGVVLPSSTLLGKVTCEKCLGSLACRGCKFGASAVKATGGHMIQVDLCSACGGDQPPGRKKVGTAKAEFEARKAGRAAKKKAAAR